MSKDLTERARACVAKVGGQSLLAAGHDNMDECPFWYDGCQCASSLRSFVLPLADLAEQQTSDLASANASILKLRAEVEEQRGRAEDAERHCSELTTARNKQDEARALACYQRDEALAELAKLKGQQP